MKYKKIKMNKYEKQDLRKKKLEQALKGTGQFLFVNNTRGDIILAKPPIQGPNPQIPPEKQLTIPAGRTFVGDSYFFCLLKTNDVRLIEVIKPPEDPNKVLTERKEENMSEKKLILDQPETYTDAGQVEHIVEDKNKDKKKKVLKEQKPGNNKLITEDPVGGVEIILS